LTFSERELRDALGLFSTGIIVATSVTEDGRRLGNTISSFNSVSLSPPLILFSIARKSRSFADWMAVKAFAANVLSEDQLELSNRFASSPDRKWEGVETIEGAVGMPLIRGASVIFECTTFARYDGGDHMILVGEVAAFMVGGPAARPLLFYKGSYHRLDPGVSHPAPPAFEPFSHGW
jgi:flavin reductase (DIM6/NTAB) family NADH-FMN oxidoreductase RutF